MTEREKEIVCDHLCRFPEKASSRYPSNPDASQRALDRYCEKCPLAKETEWHDLTTKTEWHDLTANPEDVPEDGMMCIVEIHGSDVIKMEDGETLKQAVERISKIVHTDTGYYSTDDKMWADEFGCPLIVQPSYWKRIDMSPREESRK